jgi:hypothetical protein
MRFYLYSGYCYEQTQSKNALKMSLMLYNSMVLERIYSYRKERRILIYFFRVSLFRVLYSLSFEKVYLFVHFDLTKILECFILLFKIEST